VGGPTIVEWEERLLPPVFPYVGAAIMRPVLRRVFQGDLERLATMVAVERAARARDGAAGSANPAAARAPEPASAESDAAPGAAPAPEAQPAPRKRRRKADAPAPAAEPPDAQARA
jgi:hypothetical protein